MCKLRPAVETIACVRKCQCILKEEDSYGTIENGEVVTEILGLLIQFSF
jgi:hypothetical protein